MNEKAAVSALAALAQEARLRVFRALVGAGPEGMTPSALSAMLDIPGSTLSFHLKELAHAELISVERDGRNLPLPPGAAAHERAAGLPHRSLLHGQQVLCSRRHEAPHPLLTRRTR